MGDSEGFRRGSRWSWGFLRASKLVSGMFYRSFKNVQGITWRCSGVFQEVSGRSSVLQKVSGDIRDLYNGAPLKPLERSWNPLQYVRTPWYTLKHPCNSFKFIGTLQKPLRNLWNSLWSRKISSEHYWNSLQRFWNLLKTFETLLKHRDTSVKPHIHPWNFLNHT